MQDEQETPTIEPVVNDEESSENNTLTAVIGTIIGLVGAGGAVALWRRIRRKKNESKGPELPPPVV